jgi:CHAT domain-containing protein
MTRTLVLGCLLFSAVALGQDDPLRKWREILAAPAPTSGRPQNLTEIFQKRAEAARALGDTDRELAELDAGLKLIGTEQAGSWLWYRLAAHYGDRGNFRKALEAGESLLKLTQAQRMRGWEHFALAVTTGHRAAIYDLPGSAASLKQMLAMQNQFRTSPFWAQMGNLWQTQSAWANGIHHALAGHMPEAEASFQACLGTISQHFGGTLRANDDNAFYAVDCASKLIFTLRMQGKLTEAGAIAVQYRDFLEAFAAASQRPLMISRTGAEYAAIAMEQGRFGDARKIIDDAIARLRAAQSEEGSFWLARLRNQAALIEMVEGNWAKAEMIHRERRAGLNKRGDAAGSNYAYVLVRLGRAAEAVEVMRDVVARQKEIFDESSLVLWDNRAFYGIALGAAGEREAALAELSVAVPKVLELSHGERSSADSGIVRAKRIGWILDGYINLLSEIHRAGGPSKVDPVNEAFRLADLARGSTVQRALAASASRANLSDPALAQLVRSEQDRQREISSLSDAIGNLLARGRLSEQDKIIGDMRANLVKLRAQQTQTLRDLQRRYPDYANLIDPKPLDIAALQKVLKPHEALVSIYVGSDRTLVWAIPAQGKPVFAIVALTESEITAKVKKLREALDPPRGIPAYDFVTAHELYSKLLAPVEAGWGAAKELVLVPHARLGSLPFATLVTTPFTPQAAGAEFAGYADAPWLLKKVAISQLPAVLAISSLRGRSQPDKATRAFLGFGDPIFSASAAAAPAANRGVSRRNLALAESAASAPVSMAAQADVGLLAALPDTSEEINDIAKVLKAEPARDLFLQKRATESNVKAQDMSGYRIVMFATHGLVPGEMPGLYQPALALSNPALTGEKEDGLLTMEEILALKLRADWVVLSACNTASPSGEGSEAVSGLGRAFFYAGAKALLVSSWPVETVSARLLTTDVFRRQAENPAASRAGALREASLGIMKQGTRDFSYAHPLFWAPFIIVGDGG